MKIVIIVCTYNEAESTPSMLVELDKVVNADQKHKIEVLYVDDSSPDGTSDIIRKSQSNYKWLHLLVNPKKNGLGAAYAVGMSYAMSEMHADYIMEFDADFQHPPKDIPRLIAKVDEGYEYVIASRYISGGSIPKEWSMERKFLSVVGNLVARILLVLPQLHDVTGGFKLSKVRGFMDEFDFSTLLSKRFAYKVHLLYYMVKKGAKTVEVPFAFSPRNAGESKIIKNELQETLRVIFWLQVKNPKMRRFVKFGTVGLIGFVINSITLEIFSNTYLPTFFAKIFYFLDSLPVLNLFAHEPAWAGALSAECAIISNFLLNNYWTFASHKAKTLKQFTRKLLKFNATSLGAVLIQFAVIGTGTLVFGNTTLIRQVFLIIAIGFFIVPYNWLMYNKVIWKTGKKASSQL